MIINSRLRRLLNSYKLAVWERTLPKKYKFITIGDWDKVARAHQNLFAGTDGTHFGGRDDISKLYLDCIKGALTRAENTPVKKQDEKRLCNSSQSRFW